MSDLLAPTATTDPRGLIFITPSAFADMDRWHATAAELRREAPILRVEAAGWTPFWAVTRHADVFEVSRRSDVFWNTVRSAPGPDLQALMLAVVAEKTGYPAEMLTLDMALEADLGIDSIKRVEILSAVQERTPSLPPLDPSAMAALRTVGEIAAYLARQGGGVATEIQVAVPAAKMPGWDVSPR